MAREDVDLRNDVRTSTAPTAYEVGTRRVPETKTFLASSEFWVMAGAIVALFIGGYILDDIADANAWKYATWVAIAYIVSRGIAKAGSRREYEPVYERRPMSEPRA
jgi:hypothetical protein